MEQIKQNIVIEQVKPEQVVDIQNVIYQSSKEASLSMGFSLEDIARKFEKLLSPETAKNVAESITQASENEKHVVVLDGEKVVGYSLMEVQPDKNALGAMFVLPEYQGRGLATKLWQEILPFLDPQKDTYVNVYVGNQNAIGFYQKIGFVATGKVTATDFKGENGQELSEMEMMISKK